MGLNQAVSIVLLDTRDGGTGLYIEAGAVALGPGPDIDKGHSIYARTAASLDMTFPPIPDLQAPASQRLYVARPSAFWVNFFTRNAQGFIVKDEKVPVTLANLLA